MMVDKSFARRRRKESFDSVATYYEKYRPGYPSQVIDGVLEMTEFATVGGNQREPI